MNIATCIMHIHPTAINGVDFIVQDDSNGEGSYIAEWKVPNQKPTQEELATAWEIIKDRPPAKTPEQKKFDKLAVDNEQLNLQVIDLFEQLIIKGVL